MMGLSTGVFVTSIEKHSGSQLVDWDKPVFCLDLSEIFRESM